jgi:hypothetical protein
VARTPLIQSYNPQFNHCANWLVVTAGDIVCLRGTYHCCLEHCNNHQGSIQREKYEEQAAENTVNVFDASGTDNDINLSWPTLPKICVITEVNNCIKGKCHPMTSLCRLKCSPKSFATSALEEVGGQNHALAALPSARTGTHFAGSWMGPGRTFWTGAENLTFIGIRYDRPVRCYIDYSIPAA